MAFSVQFCGYSWFDKFICVLFMYFLLSCYCLTVGCFAIAVLTTRLWYDVAYVYIS